MATTLKLKVHALNETRKIANIEYDNVMKQIKKYVGTKITKVDGKFFKSFDIDLKRENHTPASFTPGGHAATVNLYISNSAYSLYLNVRTCFSGGEGSQYSKSPNPYYCHYEEVTFCIGEIKDHILVEIFDDKKPSEMVDYEDTIKKIDEYNALMKLADAKRSEVKIYGFNEYWRGN